MARSVGNFNNFFSHISNSNSHAEDKDLYTLIFSELKSLGIKVPKVKKFKSNVLKQDKSILDIHNKIFGTSLQEQEWISHENCPLPKFISSTTEYLQKFSKNQVGLFRKAGSVARQRQLRANLEKGEDFGNAEPNDVAALLKQWLRELPEAVVPRNLHDLFVKCISLPSEDSLSAVLLCCLLLPSEHLYTLKHLLKFLSSIAKDSGLNKMDTHNLAVVMAPNLFSCTCERLDKSSSGLVQSYTNVVELLIENADKIGEITPKLSSLLSQKMEEDFPIEPLECSPARFQKKQRSGGVTDVLNGIRKFVGGNLTPLNNCLDHSTDEQKITPTRSAKRKADPDLHEISVVKKLAVNKEVSSNIQQSPLLTPVARNVFSVSTPGCAPLLNTPSLHLRKKSFGLLGSKRKKRGKSPKVTVRNPKPSIDVQNQVLINREKVIKEKSPLKEEPKVYQQYLTVAKEIPPTIDMHTLTPPAVNISGQKIIKRTKSDQPLGVTKSLCEQQLHSVSQSNLPTRHLSPLNKANAIPKKKSPLLHHVAFKNKGLSKSPKLSPAVAKKLDAILPKQVEKQVFRRAGSTRRSSKRRANIKLADKNSFVSPAAISQSPNLRRNASRNRSLRNSRKNIPSNHIVSVVTVAQDKKVSEIVISPSVGPQEALQSSPSLNCNGDTMNKSPCINIAFTTPESKKGDSSAMKRGGNKSSLRRGRPNTVKTGLKSELCPKYSNESVTSLKFDQIDGNAPLSAKKYKIESEELALTNEEQSSDVSIKTLKVKTEENIGSLSICDTMIEDKMVVMKEKVPVPDHSENLSKPSNPCLSDLLFSIASVDDLTPATYAKPRRYGSSTNVKILTPMLNNTPASPRDVNQENKFTPQKDEEDQSDFSSEMWQVGADHLFVRRPSTESCKRESIVQLLAKNAGKVHASVQHYNHIAGNSSGTPGKVNGNSFFVSPAMNSSVPSDKLSTDFTPLHKKNSLKITQSDSRMASRSTRCRKTPLPPIPKFCVTDVENNPTPLKEVTNFNKSISPAITFDASPNLPPPRKKDLVTLLNTSKITAKRSVKAHRSESSPLFTIPRKEVCCFKARSSDTPSPRNLKSSLMHSQSFNSTKEWEENRVPTRSASKRDIVFVDELNTYQQMNEWECDM